MDEKWRGGGGGELSISTNIKQRVRTKIERRKQDREKEGLWSNSNQHGKVLKKMQIVKENPETPKTTKENLFKVCQHTLGYDGLGRQSASVGKSKKKKSTKNVKTSMMNFTETGGQSPR